MVTFNLNLLRFFHVRKSFENLKSGLSPEDKKNNNLNSNLWPSNQPVIRQLISTALVLIIYDHNTIVLWITHNLWSQYGFAYLIWPFILMLIPTGKRREDETCYKHFYYCYKFDLPYLSIGDLELMIRYKQTNNYLNFSIQREAY